MQTQSTLSEGLIAQFKQIMEDRTPMEACGVLLPTPYRRQRIWEMPNRSLRSHDSFKMRSADVRMALQEWIDANPALITEVTFWHSHPSGNSTPSKEDLDNRVSQACNLVLALDDEGEVIFSWY